MRFTVPSFLAASIRACGMAPPALAGVEPAGALDPAAATVVAAAVVPAAAAVVVAAAADVAAAPVVLEDFSSLPHAVAVRARARVPATTARRVLRCRCDMAGASDRTV